VSTIIVILHVINCVVLILAVMLQSGKSADLAGAFGGVGSQTAFGPRGSASFLSKITTISAVIFMLTSIGLWMFSGGSKSVLSGEKAAPPAATAPAPKTEAPKTQTPTEQKAPEAGQAQQQKPPAAGETQPKK
jgi:preprotein translocase subunit SecG